MRQSSTYCLGPAPTSRTAAMPCAGCGMRCGPDTGTQTHLNSQQAPRGGPRRGRAAGARRPGATCARLPVSFLRGGRRLLYSRAPEGAAQPPPRGGARPRRSGSGGEGPQGGPGGGPRRPGPDGRHGRRRARATLAGEPADPRRPGRTREPEQPRSAREEQTLYR